MQTLSVKEINYYGFVSKRDQVSNRLTWFSHDFQFGKSYLLHGELWDGGWALSQIIAGLLEPNVEPAHAQILLDGVPYPTAQRKKDVWVVPRSEIKRYGLFQNMTVQEQIQHGLKNNSQPYLKSENDYIEHFRLTPERYTRPFRMLSHERWSASCAVGVANGKKIFCFPYINYVRPEFIEEYYELWFKAQVDLLRDSGALVLIPALAEGVAATLCDEIVPMRRKFT